MVRQERAEVTRSAILDGAARAFDAEGYHGTSLGDIVKEAGVTKGALYFHFGSKEELAQALVDEQFSALESVTDTGKPGVQTVIDIVHTMARLLVADVRVRAASAWSSTRAPRRASSASRTPGGSSSSGSAWSRRSSAGTSRRTSTPGGWPG